MDYSLKNPKEAVAALVKRHPEVSAEVAEGQWAETVELLESEATRTKGYGWIDRKKMQFTIDTVVPAFELKRVPTPEELYTNDFLSRKGPRGLNSPPRTKPRQGQGDEEGPLKGRAE